MLQIRHATTHAVLLEVDGDTLEGQNLTEAHLDGASLPDMRLQYACLRNARLSRADLRRSALNSATIDGADLNGANLSSSDLSLATLLGALLQRVDLQGGILRYAKLTGADLQFANLQGADLSMSDARANFYHANLAGCDLRGANLSGANLQMADLTDADLTNANIAGTVFLGAKLRGAKMPAHATAKDLVALTTQRPRAPAAEPTPNRYQPDADWRPIETHGFEQLPVICPECGLKVKNASMQADGRYRCRGCQAVFSEEAARKAISSSFRSQRDADFLEMLAGRAQRTKSFELLWQGAMVVAAAVSLLIMVFLGMKLYHFFTLPEGLADRSVRIAEDFVSNSPADLRAMATSNTESLIADWLRRRPARLDTARGVQIKVSQQMELNVNQAFVIVQVETPDQTKPDGNPESFSLALMFMRNSLGEKWVWDCAATVNRAPPSY
jgi:uncharacterized protein YjbI with pentapeptide repeats